MNRATLDAIASGTLSTFLLPLRADREVQEFIATVQTLETRSHTNFTITGALVADAGSTVVISREEDALVGAIISPRFGSHTIHANDAQSLVIDRVNANALPGCGCTAAQQIGRQRREAQQPSPHTQQAPEAADSYRLPCDSVIDVLIAYTPRVRTALGSDAAARAFAYANIAATNIAFENSIINARVRLVHVAAVEYIESSSIAIDLDRLQVNGDGHMDIIHSLRQQHGADLVALLVDSTFNSCGVAYVMTQPTSDFRTHAFSVTQHFCALANFSFAHELAHNLGCQHDWSDPSPGVFAYSHGHRFTGQGGGIWRTMMAGSSGVRIPYFSNPDLWFDGAATGVPEGQPNPADNARSINQIAPIASAFIEQSGTDCNGNSVPDSCDIAAGTSLDANTNGVPDECDALPCPPLDIQKIAPAHQLSFDRFGCAVAMSDDRLAISALMNDDAGNTVGAAYVFAKSASARGSQWMQEAQLAPATPLLFQQFGQSIAISPGGAYIIVGSHRDGFQISDVGSAYIFHRDASGWAEVEKFDNPDPQQQDWFGWSVSFAGDERGQLHAIVGTPLDDEAAINAGAVYVYRKLDSGWSAPVKLTAPDAQANARFGWAVAGDLHAARLIAGAPLLDGAAPNTGSATIFQHDENGHWVVAANLSDPQQQEEARFGTSVAIDASAAIIGAPGDNQFGVRAGAAHVFRHDANARAASGNWMHEMKLTSAEADAQEQFGSSVAIRGEHAVIGSILDTFNSSASGSAFIFRRHLGQWIQQARLAPIDAASFDNLGNAVAVAPTQPLALAGAQFDDHNGLIDSGTAAVFSLAIDAADCNGNGAADHCDIANGVSQDDNANSVPDECETTPCVGDIVAPHDVVNVNDLLAVINAWGPCDPSCPAPPCLADVNGDCAVNVNDLLDVISHWGPCP